MKILITGASGMLGRAIFKKFNSSCPEDQIIGLSFSRGHNQLKSLDLCHRESTEKFLIDLRPDLIVHCAAIRHPETCENDHETTDALNINASLALANYCKAHGIPLIYISTDYVFPGDAPPYNEDSMTKPLNYYGMSKLKGEQVVRESGCVNTILRIPVLYGEVECIDESAITVIAKSLFNNESKTFIDNWAARYPTHVEDVAEVVLKIVNRHRSGDSSISGVLHYSGDEKFTKYEIAKIIGNAFRLDHAHLVPVNDAPSGPPRPKNTNLDHSKLKQLGIDSQRSFEAAIQSVLKPHMANFITH